MEEKLKNKIKKQLKKIEKKKQTLYKLLRYKQHKRLLYCTK